MLKSQIQLSQYDRCQTQLSKKFKQCRPFQIYQSALGYPRFSRGKAKKPRDHIEKVVFVTSASIFSETVGGMKLKFGEEIQGHPTTIFGKVSVRKTI